MSKKIVALVLLTSDGTWDVTFHGSKKAANQEFAKREADGFVVDDEHPGWVIEKLEDITAEETAMSPEHLNSFIRQFISAEHETKDLVEDQNLVWNYLSHGGDAPEEQATEQQASEKTEGEASMAAATETEGRKRPARRDRPAKKGAANAAPKKAAPKKKAAAKKANGRAEPRADSKVQKVVEMMKRKGGATVADIAKALDWETKSVHGVISGILRKKLNLDPKITKTDKGNAYSL